MAVKGRLDRYGLAYLPPITNTSGRRAKKLDTAFG
jgi:hypothetical protein